MRYPALPKEKRLTAAAVAGQVSRLTVGSLRELPLERKVVQLHQVTRDPEILGHELGPYLAEQWPNAGTAAAVELLRAAGADEDVASLNAAWQRERQIREQGGGPRA